MEVKLLVGSYLYGGWTSIRVIRGVETLCGAFELEVSDRWGEGDLWEITEEDEATLFVDGVSVISGYVDRRSISFAPGHHKLSVSGRDKAAALVDCSAVLSSWEFASLPLLTLAQRLATPFGIDVKMDDGINPKSVTLNVGKKQGSVTAAGGAGKSSGTAIPQPLSKFTIDPGESAWEVLERACRMAGVLAVSDGFGGIVLTRAGNFKASTAISNDNVKEASADYDAAARYRTYIVSTQAPGTDEFFGAAAANIKATATDPEVQRAERVLMVRPEAGLTQAQAAMRAQWEAKIRAARGDSVRVVVPGWTMDDGNLWPVGATVSVHLPALGIRGDMLIAQAVHTIDNDTGVLTAISLKRPDAFKPEPVVGPTIGYWKEIAQGVR